MKPLAISTMFAQQPRFDDGAAFARYALDAGYDAIEISHSTPEAKLRQILESARLPVTSVHQPAPWIRLADGRGNQKCNLASLDDDERRLAVEFAVQSIRWAAEIGAPRSVVHLGAVTDVAEQFPEELELRRAFDSGAPDEARMAELREALIASRKATAEPYVAAARRSLEDLVRAAEPHGIALGIENRYHYHEIPLPDEYDLILDGFVSAQAGYWHDTGHVEVLHRLGLVDRHAWLPHLGSRAIGAHLHDVLGIGDHRSPGNGDVDWGYITAGIGHLPSYTLEINQHEPDDRVAAAPSFLESQGLR